MRSEMRQLHLLKERRRDNYEETVTDIRGTDMSDILYRYATTLEITLEVNARTFWALPMRKAYSVPVTKHVLLYTGLVLNLSQSV